ncbi:MAG: hypothetical protein ABIS67_05450 [Candidatus Eisenbacteria bacterium]
MNRLVILPRRMTIPYGGSGAIRTDGGANYGFANLKQQPHLIDTVPELAHDPALKSVVSTINRHSTGLFSSACESCQSREHRGYRYSGYVEFAINSDSEAADATSYFTMFHSFGLFLNSQTFAQRVTFQWEICPAHFADICADGFSTSVRIDTDSFGTVEEALTCWQTSLGALEAFLGSIPKPAGEPIYSPDRR